MTVFTGILVVLGTLLGAIAFLFLAFVVVDFVGARWESYSLRSNAYRLLMKDEETLLWGEVDFINSWEQDYASINTLFEGYINK